MKYARLNLRQWKGILSMMLLVLTAGQLHSQKQNEFAPYRYVFADHDTQGEVRVINANYALVINNYRVDVYSMKTGRRVQSHELGEEAETWEQPGESFNVSTFAERVENWYYRHHRDVCDPASLPTPDLKMLAHPAGKTYYDYSERLVTVTFRDGSTKVYEIPKKWEAAEFYYNDERKSLMLFESFKLFSVAEIGADNKLKVLAEDIVAEARYFDITGSVISMENMIYDLATQKVIYEWKYYSFDKFYRPKMLGNGHVFLENYIDGTKYYEVHDIHSNQMLVSIKAPSRSERIASLDGQFYVKYIESKSWNATRALVYDMSNNLVCELVSPEGAKQEDESKQSITAERIETAKVDAFNDSLYNDFITNVDARMKKFNEAVNTWIAAAEKEGWKVENRKACDAVKGGRYYFDSKEVKELNAEKNYWQVQISALPFLESKFQIWFSEWTKWGDFGIDIYDDVIYTHDYSIGHTGLIQPYETINYTSTILVDYPAKYFSMNRIVSGMVQNILFSRPANDPVTSLPEFQGSSIPAAYDRCFTIVYEKCKKAYTDDLQAEAERQRREALEKLPNFTSPQPGSALYNLQMAIDAAVPATWNTCGACGGTGMLSSPCACCNGRGGKTVGRQVFHEMSQKTDVVYDPNGAQGAGYYRRTTPIGYYKTETSYESCVCCSGSGLISGTSVCNVCGGAGRVKP